MKVIDVADAPRTVAVLHALALDCGWTARITQAEGELVNKTGARAIRTVCLRLRRRGEFCYATWDVTEGCRFFSAADLSRLRPLNVSQFTAHVAA